MKRDIGLQTHYTGRRWLQPGPGYLRLAQLTKFGPEMGYGVSFYGV